MTFDEILAQVLDLLQRQGRVSYRALKRRFDLDDAYLEDLKAEIIKAQRLAIDEDGEVLVWAGAAPPQTQGPQPPETPAPQDIPISPPTIGREAPEAERRQLTVLFCDLVDSTALAARLDPEELREVVRAYQAACAEMIGRFEGHIAQYLGDGLLVYFGYPLAHEDDAQRAVRAGLGMLEVLEQLNMRLARERGIRLAVRLGIHTGLVVVGEMGAGTRYEQLALGETPNLAARLQGLAAPDTVVISATTYRLVQGFFACHALGSQTLKGSPTPVLVYHVLGESGAQSRLETAGPRGLTPLVGREPEVTLLQERWAQSTDGLGQVVLLSGEAGIGKSRLVQVLKAHVEGEPHTRLECRCSPYYQNSALYPVIDLFQRMLQLHRDDTPQQKLSKLEGALEQYGFPLPDMVPLFASLLSLPLSDHYPALTLTPQRQRQKTLEAVLAVLLALAARQPLLFIVEDLHWVDPSTLELLSLLLDQGPTAPMMTLLTCRPEFRSPWGFRAHLTPITLNRLPRTQVAVMVE
jgi:class 3 adenylate cyclase